MTEDPLTREALYLLSDSLVEKLEEDKSEGNYSDDDRKAMQAKVDEIWRRLRPRRETLAEAHQEKGHPSGYERARYRRDDELQKGE